MDPLPAGKTFNSYSTIEEKENKNLTVTQSRIENHKKIMAHLEAISKLLDVTPKKQE